MAIGVARRQFMATVSGAAVAWPLAARAAGALPRIGVLDIQSADSDARNLAVFRDGLQRLGYVDGRTVDITYRYSDGDTDALTGLAQQLVQLRPSVVLASAVTPTRVMKRTDPALPIVCPAFSGAFIPNLAASFAHPGGSVTGVASDVEGLISKLTELTLDAVPSATKIGFLANPAGGSMARFEQQVQTAAQARGVEVSIEHVEKLGDLEQAFHRFSEEQVRATIVPPNGLLSSGRMRIIELALAFHLPLIFAQRDGVDGGGLASYGINTAESYSRAATYVDKILRGAAPGDLPIEFPTKLELVVNLKTAKMLGITIPAALLGRADEVIE